MQRRCSRGGGGDWRLIGARLWTVAMWPQMRHLILINLNPPWPGLDNTTANGLPFPCSLSPKELEWCLLVKIVHFTLKREICACLWKYVNCVAIYVLIVWRRNSAQNLARGEKCQIWAMLKRVVCPHQQSEIQRPTQQGRCMREVWKSGHLPYKSASWEEQNRIISALLPLMMMMLMMTIPWLS